MYITNDLEWKELVRRIAKGPYLRPEILDAAGYLWDSMNWDRLMDTSYGRFIRECHNEVPDLLLRSTYAKEVLSDQ